jgi:hypothetical protein
MGTVVHPKAYRFNAISGNVKCKQHFIPAANQAVIITVSFKELILFLAFSASTELQFIKVYFYLDEHMILLYYIQFFIYYNIDESIFDNENLIIKSIIQVVDNLLNLHCIFFFLNHVLFRL